MGNHQYNRMGHPWERRRPAGIPVDGRGTPRRVTEFSSGGGFVFFEVGGVFTSSLRILVHVKTGRSLDRPGSLRILPCVSASEGQATRPGRRDETPRLGRGPGFNRGRLLAGLAGESGQQVGEQDHDRRRQPGKRHNTAEYRQHGQHEGSDVHLLKCLNHVRIPFSFSFSFSSLLPSLSLPGMWAGENRKKVPGRVGRKYQGYGQLQKASGTAPVLRPPHSRPFRPCGWDGRAIESGNPRRGKR